MHVLSRKSIAVPQRCAGPKAYVLQRRICTIASCRQRELFGPSSLLELYFDPRVTEALVRSFWLTGSIVRMTRRLPGRLPFCHHEI